MCCFHHCDCRSSRQHGAPPRSKGSHGRRGKRGHHDRGHHGDCRRPEREGRCHDDSGHHEHSRRKHQGHHHGDECCRSQACRCNCHCHQHDHHPHDRRGGHCSCRRHHHHQCQCHHHEQRHSISSHRDQESEECCGGDESHDHDEEHETGHRISEDTRIAQLRVERDALRDEMEWIDQKIADLEGEGTDEGTTESE